MPATAFSPGQGGLGHHFSHLEHVFDLHLDGSFCPVPEKAAPVVEKFEGFLESAAAADRPNFVPHQRHQLLPEGRVVDLNRVQQPIAGELRTAGLVIF
ncbi:MAG: hypothetical protein BWY80_00540 [Firmicutes bacterium ADurb.Bin456]|nr:MAG: hypothetical protein BWY80_00540 [Firmicutes bacterium ADurb.Bin456]